jgi:predicted transposase YbfD/YdcC
MAQPAQLTRRMVGFLNARLPDLQLQTVPDARDPRWVKWRMATVLRVLIVSMTAGCVSLLQAEALTQDMSADMRRALKILRRIPDTTLRTIAAALDPDDIRPVMHHQIRAAHRRKALEPDELPFNTVMLDGKNTAIPSCDDYFAQRQSQDGGLVGILRTMTCSLVTTAAQPCIDAFPIPAQTNEMGVFSSCVDSLVRTYGSIDLFRMVAADAGNCSESNARHARGHGLHYLFSLKGNQPTLEAEAQRLLGDQQHALASTEDWQGNGLRVVRRLYLTEQIAGFQWDHLKTVLRVESRSYAHGRLTASEDRYLVSSLPSERLTPAKWLRLIRLMWGVENAVHCTLDKSMREDEHPWIESNPRGALVLALLRRIAYNLLTLFRSVTLRAEHTRAAPWKSVMRWIELALLTAGPSDVDRLRPRTPAVVGTS